MLKHTAQFQDDFNDIALSDKIGLAAYLQDKCNIQRNPYGDVIFAVSLARLSDDEVDARLNNSYKATDTKQKASARKMIKAVRAFRTLNPPRNYVKELYTHFSGT